MGHEALVRCCLAYVNICAGSDNLEMSQTLTLLQQVHVALHSIWLIFGILEKRHAGESAGVESHCFE